MWKIKQETENLKFGWQIELDLLKSSFLGKLLNNMEIRDSDVSFDSKL